MEFASLTGHTFSLAEKTAIETSTPLLLSETKQSRIKIWGKVFGFKADYILVQCIGQAALSACLTFFSLDGGITYTLLDTNSVEKDELCQKIKGTYMGDAAYEYRVVDPSTNSEVAVKESERLAYFVRMHDFHCRVIPRGSQLLYEDGSIRLNATFEGLDREAAGKLSSYLHVRTEVRRASLLEKEGVADNVDFLDPLSDDIPSGVWAMKYDPVLDVVYGSSMMFLGAVFYHKPGTKIFNNVYIGDGVVNEDRPFMM